MKKGNIRLILEEQWDGFLSLYSKRVRKNVKSEVEKVLKWNPHVHMMV